MSSYYEKFADGKVVCIDDEIPFEIPAGWEWTRTVNVFDVWSARRVHEKDWRSSGIPFYRAREIGKLADYGYVNNDLFIDETLYNEFSKSGLPYKNDLMVTAVGTIGKVYVVPDDKPFYYKDGSVLCFNNFGDLDPAFIKAVIESPMFVSQYGMESQGTTVATLTIIRVNQYLIPIPPISEQHRIVSCLRSVADAVEKYDKSQNSLNKLNAGIGSRLKASILQEAIQGKLMAQDPNDEPAEKLLEKISAEKQRLVKEGKLKAKDAITSVIFKGEDNKYYEQIGSKTQKFDGEIPFELPDSWTWTRVSSLAKLISGTSFDKADVSSEGIRILRGGNIVEYSIEFRDDDIFLPKRYVDNEKNISDGDIVIVASTGSITAIGRPAFVHGSYNNIQIGAFLRIVRPLHINVSQWLSLIFETTYYRDHISDCVKGTSINNIKADYVLNMLVPLPPKQEQQRIVQKIAEIQTLIQ